MASMIYGVIKNGRRGIGYVPKEKPISKPKEKPKALNSHFSHAYTQSFLRTLGELTRNYPKRYGYLIIR